jgi:NAD(P)-dependent dehydrogenase (short-subunit alcohol dehydrogenase family)
MARKPKWFYGLAGLTKKRLSRRQSMKHAVLVTGASTGIGRAIVERLLESGCQVFASVRREQDAEALTQGCPGAIPVLFDVTDAQAVERAQATISKLRDPERVFHVVNNAGIAVAGPLELVPLERFKEQFDVNVFGLVKVTQVFLPWVREHGGRIINMSSVSGLVASPFLGPYSASKFAVEALSDSLRREVAAQGVKVVVIEPGPIQTPIWDKGLAAGQGPLELGVYEKAVQRFEKMVSKIAARAIPAKTVADAVLDAIVSKNPPTRRVITAPSGRLEVTLGRLLPTKWVDRAIVQQLFGS